MDKKKSLRIGVLVFLSVMLYTSLLGAQVLVIAPHPDDDIILTAGVIYRAHKRGDSVKVVYVTNGDYYNQYTGYARQDEAVEGQSYLGIPENQLIFLGYPDGYLREIYQNYLNPGDDLVTDNGISETYADRGLGHIDYHSYIAGTPGLYNRPSIVGDLADIISNFLPDHIYTTSEFDYHPDHNITYDLLTLALASVRASHPNYSPIVHKTIVHWEEDGWPDSLDPTSYYTELPDLAAQTDLSWADRESLDVPLPMQSTDYPENPKYTALDSHASQGGVLGYDGWLGRYIHKDEIFWAENPFGANHPPIVNAGLDQTAQPGDVVHLDGSQSHDPDGDFLTYQWVQASGATQVQLSGANTATPSFTVPVDLPHNDVVTFELIVSDAQFSSPPDAVSVTMKSSLSEPTITTQPSNQTVNPGQTATFSVTASGSAPLSYQWQKNGSEIPGATSASYTTPPATSGDSGKTFRCVVTNSAGSATSHNATLTVRIPPAVTGQPEDTTVNLGQTAVFSITASGTAPLSYQWQKNGSNIAGATSASYTTPPTTESDNGKTFRCVVTNAAGTATSNSAALTVNLSPVITGQPGDRTVNLGQTAIFSVTASGSAPLSYQWRKSGSDIPGATSASYTTPATTGDDDGATFRCVVTNSAGNATSNSATLTVRIPPAVTSQPSNQTVNLGQTATFSITASGTAPLSYQWQKNGSNIAGATSASYTTPPTTEGDNGKTFRCVVTNAADSVPSNAAALTVVLSPIITGQPGDKTVNLGQTATFSITATGAAPLSYQWQESGSDISGATSASYTTPATTANDDGATFRCVVTNAHGNSISHTATLTVFIPPAITGQPANRSIDRGQQATFSVVASGSSPLTYQWERDEVEIPGATSASYTTPATTDDDTGATFRCIVTNAAGSATSAGATLKVVVPLQAIFNLLLDE